MEKELGVKNLPEAIKQLNKKLNIPLNLKDVDEVEISEAKFKEVLDRMSKNAYEDPCTLTNPRQSNPEIVKMIYVHAFEGKDITE